MPKGLSGRSSSRSVPRASSRALGTKISSRRCGTIRKIEVPAGWAGRKVLLHFGGVDYHCEAFIDGVSVGPALGRLGLVYL